MMVVKFSHFSEERERARRSSSFPKGLEGAWGWERPAVLFIFGLSVLFILFGLLNFWDLAHNPIDSVEPSGVFKFGLVGLVVVCFNWIMICVGLAGIYYLYKSRWLI